MAHAIDARGLACPQPVLLTMEAIKSAGTGEIEILVDNEASRENVSRAALAQGWEITVSEKVDEDFRLLIRKK